jgi:GTPase SAR1 family protein
LLSLLKAKCLDNALFIMSFGVLIVGPSGSGKSTLTHCLSHIYRQLEVSVTIINLDPANDSTNKYTPDIDINDLIRVEDVMEEFGIG